MSTIGSTERSTVGREDEDGKKAVEDFARRSATIRTLPRERVGF